MLDVKSESENRLILQLLDLHGLLLEPRVSLLHLVGHLVHGLAHPGDHLEDGGRGDGGGGGGSGQVGGALKEVDKVNVKSGRCFSEKVLSKILPEDRVQSNPVDEPLQSGSPE